MGGFGNVHKREDSRGEEKANRGNLTLIPEYCHKGWRGKPMHHAAAMSRGHSYD